MKGGVVLDFICSAKYGAFFTIARPFIDIRISFQDFLDTSVFLDDVNS